MTLRYLFRVALVVALVPIGPAWAKEAMTLDDIARIKAVTWVSVSPDGNAIAWLQSDPRIPFEDDDGKARTRLMVKRGDADARQYAGGETAVSKVHWSPGSDALFYLSENSADDKQKVLYSIPLDGGMAKKVCRLKDKRNISSFDLHADGEQIAIVSKPPAPKTAEKAKKKGFDAVVHEEHVRSAAVGIVRPAAGEDCEPDWLEVEGHIAAASFSPDGNRLLLSVVPTPLIDDSYMQTRMRVVTLEGSTASQIGNLGKLGPRLWSPDSRRVAFIGVNDFNDPAAGRLKLADAESGDISTLIGEFDGHVREIAWAGDEHLLVLIHRGVESELWRLDVNTGDRQQVVGQGGQIITAISASTGGGTVAVLANAVSHPGEAFRVNGTALERLTDSNPWLANIEMGRQEAVNYKAKDGLDLQGLVIYPTNYRKGRRYPMIAYIHGGPESHRSNGWLNTYSTPIQVAAAKGYVAFVPNYRGSTGRGVAFSKLDQHAYATPEFEDIVDGKEHLVEIGLVDRDKVGITGGSYGGYATAWSSTALSEHYAAGVMFVGISNQLSKFGTTDIPKEMHAVHARAWPWDDWQWMLERSPIYHAENSKTPLLIMHGDSDPRVHPSQSLEMYRYLKQAGQAPVRLVWYPKEKHGNQRAASRYDYSVRLMRWMDHYLKGDGGEPPPYEVDYSAKLGGEEDA